MKKFSSGLFSGGQKDLSVLVNYFSDIIENAPDGIYITDGDANAILINRAFEKISGLDRSQLLYKNHRDLEKQGIIAKSCALEVLRQKRTVTIIHEYLTTGKQALDTCTPVFDEDGNILMTVSSIRDLTELNQLESRYEKEVTLRQKYEKQLEHIREQVSHSEDLIAVDERMTDVLVLANKMAMVDSVVAITGETGVGKEEVAQYIHKYGVRASKPFIAVNCGAIPDNLIESELFGYEGGAFTGADKKGKAGLFEAADGGTLFLDEVGELPLNIQVRLLRCLQNKKITRVGGTREIPVDVRIISATNRDLKEMVKAGTFREDLYYRLCVVPIRIPPLRERFRDIRAFADYFLERFNRQYGLQKRYSDSAYAALSSYSWPGNVRELKNLVERMVVTCESNTITADHLHLPISGSGAFPAGRSYEGIYGGSYAGSDGSSYGGSTNGSAGSSDVGAGEGSSRAAFSESASSGEFRVSLKEEVEQLEYRRIEEASRNYSNVRQAALALGMSEPTFVRKRKEYRKKFGAPSQTSPDAS